MKYFQCVDKREAQFRYGYIMQTEGKLKWIEERHNMMILSIPKFASDNIINTATKNKWFSIYCNKDMAGPLIDTLELLHVRNLIKEIKTFDGSFNPRFVRGRPGVVSCHAWGIAIDLNAKDNPLGGPCNWSEEFLNTWREMGWCIGKDFKRMDAQHFSWIGTEADVNNKITTIKGVS